MNVRCRPANLQNGCSAFTTPAPCVQRLPAPAASVTTANSPRAKAARPARAQFLPPAAGVASSTSASLHVLDFGAGGQTVLREADAATSQIIADLLMLEAVEAVLFEQFRQALPGSLSDSCRGQQAIEQRLHHAGQFRARPAGGAEFVQLRALVAGEGLRDRRRNQRGTCRA